MTDRISTAFAQASADQRACFIAYVCAGDPDPATAIEVARTLVDAGVDILELGVPFSDPLADGTTNQLAAQRALASGATHQTVFAQVKAIRAFSQVPIVFYTYYNLIYSQGIEAYVKLAKEAGVDGLLALDCPPEEAGPLCEACKKYGLKTIFIVAPTTPESRLRRIVAAASGFIYYVSREGVTGERATLADNIGAAVEKIRAATPLPVVVGFGVSSAEQVKTIAGVADGVVVGSALVNVIARNAGDPATLLAELRTKADSLIGGLTGIAHG